MDNKNKSTKAIEEYCSLHIDGFIRLQDVLAILGLGQTTFRKGVREGKLPKPYKFGPRISLWSVAEIKAIVDQIKNDAFENS